MNEAKRPLGPNMKRWVIHRMSVQAVPADGGLNAALDFLTKPGAIGEGFRQALEWCDQQVAAIRAAPEPNSWKDSTEEQIAGEVLRRIGEVKKSYGRQRPM